jgi:hypothetical protein
MNELKPCPFCGGTNICTEKGINLNYCDSCSAEANIEHWNTRPIEDELRARIAELEGERRWIPVSERLPEVYRDEDGEFIPFLVCENDKDCPYRALYDGLNWGDGMFVADVTHWMPLPEPPEVQE